MHAKFSGRTRTQWIILVDDSQWVHEEYQYALYLRGHVMSVFLGKSLVQKHILKCCMQINETNEAATTKANIYGMVMFVTATGRSAGDATTERCEVEREKNKAIRRAPATTTTTMPNDYVSNNIDYSAVLLRVAASHTKPIQEY